MSITKLIEIVKDLATTKPDNKYNPENSDMVCSYIKGTCSDGSNGCIFGQALIILDPDNREKLIQMEEASSPDVDKIEDVLYKLRFTDITHYQREWCKTVQSVQDRRKSWRTALRIARQAYPAV